MIWPAHQQVFSCAIRPDAYDVETAVLVPGESNPFTIARPCGPRFESFSTRKFTQSSRGYFEGVHSFSATARTGKCKKPPIRRPCWVVIGRGVIGQPADVASIR